MKNNTNQGIRIVIGFIIIAIVMVVTKVIQ